MTNQFQHELSEQDFPGFTTRGIRHGVCVISEPDWHFQYANDQFLEFVDAESLDALLSITPAEISPEMQPNGEPSATLAMAYIQEVQKTGFARFEWVHQSFKGRRLECVIELNRFLNQQGNDHLLAVVRRSASAELVEHYPVFFEYSEDSHAVLKAPDWRFLMGNQAMLDMFDVPSMEQFRQLTPGDLSPEHQPDGRLSAEAAYEHIMAACQTGFSRFPWQHETLTGRPISSIIELTRIGEDSVGNPMLAALCRDVTLMKQIEQMAHHDELTGLLNRYLFNIRLFDAIRARQSQGGFSLLFLIDIDSFKKVNDVYGHPRGDRLLIEVARSLKLVTREADVLARLGGDEFAVILSEVSSLERAGKLAEQFAKRLFAQVSERVKQSVYGLHTGCSVGYVVIDGSKDSEHCIRLADFCLYEAKSRGGGQAVGYDEQIDQRWRITHALESAISQGKIDEFVPYFQGQYLDSGELTGFEILARWNSPEYGLLAPESFILLAERNQLIGDIERYLLDKACALLKQWQSIPELAPLTLSVNVSPYHLLQKDFVVFLANLIEQYDVRCEQLILEITESSAFDFTLEARESVNVIKSLGVKISLDDFGMGHAPLRLIRDGVSQS